MRKLAIVFATVLLTGLTATGAVAGGGQNQNGNPGWNGGIEVPGVPGVPPMPGEPRIGDDAPFGP